MAHKHPPHEFFYAHSGVFHAKTSRRGEKTRLSLEPVHSLVCTNYTHNIIGTDTHTSRGVNRAASTTLCPNVGAAMLFSLFNAVLFMKQ